MAPALSQRITVRHARRYACRVVGDLDLGAVGVVITINARLITKYGYWLATYWTLETPYTHVKQWLWGVLSHSLLLLIDSWSLSPKQPRCVQFGRIFNQLLAPD